jgi:hypothetical protein
MTGWRARVGASLAMATLMVALSCTHQKHTAGLQQADAPDPTRAYLYGRFFIDAQSGLYQDEHMSIGFVISCMDGNGYVIRFSNQHRVEVIEVAPSRCALVAMDFWGLKSIGNLPLTERRPVGPFWLPGDALLPGRAYYLGDFYAEGKGPVGQHLIHSGPDAELEVKSEDDNFDATTAAMRAAFARFASTPTDDRMLRLGLRVPGMPRHHRGPAWDNVTEADVMTPERAARVAPFIKRGYATPAECEAACPTGDCLTFRGPDGPAVTCVVRCIADKDCPEGLACNCPDGAKSDCRPIARTAADAMAGLCLSVEATGERR